MNQNQIKPEDVRRRLVEIARETAVADLEQSGVFPVGFKLKRNMSCLCGSGIKYKKCCLPHVEEAAAEELMRRREEGE